MPLKVPLASGSEEERRSGRRFPIEADLSYLVLEGENVESSGRGTTVNISSSGVLFQSMHSIAPGRKIELSIAWSARIDGVVRLQLRISGRTVRGQAGCTGVQILRSEFRTCGTGGP